MGSMLCRASGLNRPQGPQDCEGEEEVMALENVLANTPGGEGATHKIYVLGYKGKTVEMNIEQLREAGRA